MLPYPDFIIEETKLHFIVPHQRWHPWSFKHAPPWLQRSVLCSRLVFSRALLLEFDPPRPRSSRSCGTNCRFGTMATGFPFCSRALCNHKMSGSSLIVSELFSQWGFCNRGQEPVCSFWARVVKPSMAEKGIAQISLAKPIPKLPYLSPSLDTLPATFFLPFCTVSPTCRIFKPFPRVFPFSKFLSS